MGTPHRLPGEVLGQSLTSCPRTKEGQSPGHLGEGATPFPTFSPSLCPPSSAPTWDPGGLAPPPPRVYSGRTRNRTCGHSNLNCRLRCQPDRSPGEETGISWGLRSLRGRRSTALGVGLLPLQVLQELMPLAPLLSPQPGAREWREGLGQAWEGLCPRTRDKDWVVRATEMTEHRIPRPSQRRVKRREKKKGARVGEGGEEP